MMNVLRGSMILLSGAILGSCGVATQEQPSELEGTVTSVYECTQVVESYGAEVTIEKLVLTHGSLWSTIETSFSTQKERSGYSFGRKMRYFRTERLDQNTVRFGNKERIGPAFEKKWGDYYRYFDFNRETLQLKHHTKAVNAKDHYESPNQVTTSNYFVAQCVQLS